ncbi:BCD family MFS transporter [Kamptonema cortianum]|nr:BCD family MFS transporter [Kamptonema cortianum]
MATGDFSPSEPTNSATRRTLPNVNLGTMFRLGLFQMGLGLLSLLTLGILNRVMIGELAIPGTITAGTIAMYQFVSPARIWFGQMSDSKPIRGYHRTGYIWLGLASMCIALFLAVQVVWRLNASLDANGWTAVTMGWVGLLALMFAVYGLCISSASTPFAALLVDVSEEENRSQLVGIVWSMLMVGIVVGAITGERILAGLTPETLQAEITRLFILFPLSVLVLGIIGTLGIEKKYSRYATRSSLINREDKITLRTAYKVLTASPQTGIFFTFLVIMTIGLFMQQPILEPYAGDVFDMSIAESAGLNKYWGMGILIGMAITGFAIVPRIGKKPSTRLGCLLTAGCFALIILAGLTQTPTLLKSSVFLFGLSSGVLTNSAISLMLDLTAAETAGTFIGAWGLAQAMAQAIATVSGGTIYDIGRWAFNNPMFAYGLVFAIEGLGLVAAVFLLERVNVKEFQTTAQAAILAAMESDIDG